MSSLKSQPPAGLKDVEVPDPHTALALGFWDLDVFALQGDEARPLVQFPGKVPDLSTYFD
jgi:hypothetical protein